VYFRLVENASHLFFASRRFGSIDENLGILMADLNTCFRTAAAKALFGNIYTANFIHDYVVAFVKW